MIEWIMKVIKQEFTGVPKHTIAESLELYQDNSFLAQIIRCESTHFLSSCALGWLVFVLTWTILSSSNYKWLDRYIFRVSFLFGLCASVTMHIFIDAFTDIA